MQGFNITRNGTEMNKSENFSVSGRFQMREVNALN
jgi:hypothetical protein